jgi:hypothetical protein
MRTKTGTCLLIIKSKCFSQISALIGSCRDEIKNKNLFRHNCDRLRYRSSQFLAIWLLLREIILVGVIMSRFAPLLVTALAVAQFGAVAKAQVTVDGNLSTPHPMLPAGPADQDCAGSGNPDVVVSGNLLSSKTIPSKRSMPSSKSSGSGCPDDSLVILVPPDRSPPVKPWGSQDQFNTRVPRP